jgi:hypothetical protein
VLRHRPDIAEQWSADEVALRWSRVFSSRDDATGKAIEPGEPDLAMLTDIARNGDRARVHDGCQCCVPGARIGIPCRANHDCRHRRGWRAPAFRRFGPTSTETVPVEPLRRLNVRASDQGFLPIQVEHYVMLLDWTGRELRADKRGAIPDHLAPIVERLGLNRSNWAETVRGFGRLFKQAAGRSSSLVDAAASRSRHWFQGKAAARTAFA